MGTVFKRGKKWGIDYEDPHGHRVRKMISRYREEAKKILHKVEIEILEGRYLDKKERKKVLFRDFAEQYFETYVKLENKNIKRQKYLINNLLKRFKGMSLYQMDTSVIIRYLAERKQTLRPASVNRELSMLKSMFNRAIEWEVFHDANPTNRIKKLKENNARCRWLTEQEQEELLFYCQGLTRMVVMVALKTGMRWGEIISLKWHQSSNSNYIDFDNDVIIVHESQCKSGKSRHVPLSRLLKDELLKIPKQPNTDYIFWNPQKEQAMRTVRKSFDTALKKAGINDFKFHDLRHTFASQLVRSSVDLFVVQKLLGHANPKMTQRYAHLQRDQLRSAIEKIDRKISSQFDKFEYNKKACDVTFSSHSGIPKAADKSTLS